MDNRYSGSRRRRDDYDRHYNQSRHSDRRDYRENDHGRDPRENDRKRQRYAESEEQAPPPAPPPVASTLRLVKLSSGVLPADKRIAIVDTNGVSIGRDRSYDARIRLSEMATSKFHCQIYFDSVGEQRGFYICDSGSVNGTFLQKQEDNDKESSPIRLSKSKEASKPFLLSHKDQLTVGTTTFEVHLHLKWQCDECSVRDDNEISLVHSKSDGSEAAAAAAAQADTNDATTSSWLAMKASINKKGGKPLRKRAQLDEIRKVQLKRMRAEFDAQSDGEEKSKETDNNSQTYTDRAALRRKQLGQSDIPIREKARDPTPPIAAESASVNVPISQDNKGHALLSKMGWAQGNAIGTTGDGGLVEPINATKMATARAGLGSIQAQAAEDKPWGGARSAGNSKTDPRFQEWKNRTKDALARRYEELKRE